MAESRHSFVEAFADFWRAPTPGRLGEILHPEVVLRQPLAPPLQGLTQARAEFERTWSWLPDLTARVERWHGDDASLFVEIRLSAAIGAHSVEWSAVDRFLLRGEKATERASFFDPIPLVIELPRHPTKWLSWWRSGSARPWRSGFPLTAGPTTHTAQETIR